MHQALVKHFQRRWCSEGRCCTGHCQLVEGRRNAAREPSRNAERSVLLDCFKPLWLQPSHRPQLAPGRVAGFGGRQGGAGDKVLQAAACMIRNRCADPADLKRCILRSRRRTGWCETSPRLFFRRPCSLGTGSFNSAKATPYERSLPTARLSRRFWARDHRPERREPAPDRSIGNVDPALG